MKFLFVFLLCLSVFTVHAEEGGALSLKTEPRDAEIYVDGELKGNNKQLFQTACYGNILFSLLNTSILFNS
jgi:hypothetical protein